jgi:outer membrane protein OmpA-like peptidoglycan-associated protein
MRARLRLVLPMLATLCASAAWAEPVGRFFYVAPYAGYTIFDGDLRFPIHALRDNVDYGARLGYRWNGWLGLEASGGLTSTKEDFGIAREARFLHAAADIVLTPYAGPVGGPFLLLGGGAGKLSTSDAVPDTIADEAKQGHYDVGGGLQFWFNDALGVRLEARDKMWFHNEDLTDIRAHILQFGAALTYAIGATPRDTDLDGVPDRMDKCPGTPAGARVDASGCPIDSDADGVFDGLDACPDTPRGATIDARGCPSDADADGIFDGLDQCADTPRGATVDARGCPSDADRDSVLDGIDQCPDTPLGATVDARGCPSDSDNDGVPDGLDKCPDTSTGLKVDKDGCPIEVTERETELLDTGMIRLQNVNFETAKWDLPPEALPALDVIGQVLAKWPDLRIEIGGHTDARGSDGYNRDLSQKRVQSVLAHLLKQFPDLKPEQYVTRGYGESQPIVPNTSALNMAKNRRVEFKVLNTEVLRREIERRRLLKDE